MADSKQDKLIEESKRKHSERAKVLTELPEKTPLELIAEKLHKQNGQTSGAEHVTLIKEALGKTLEGLTSGSDKEKKESLKQSRLFLSTVRGMQLDLGDQKEDIMKIYNDVIEKAMEGNSTLKIIADDLSNNLLKKMPTVKSFLDAVVDESSPLLRTGLNIFKDIASFTTRTKEEKKEQLKAAEASISALKSQEDKTDKAAKALSESADEQKKATELQRKPKAKSAAGQGPLVSRMELVRKESEIHTDILKKLLKVWTGEDYVAPAALTAKDEESTKTDTLQLKQAEDTNKQVKELVKKTDEQNLQNKEMLKIEKEKLVDAEKDKLKSDNVKTKTDVPLAGITEPEKKGFWGKILGGIAGVLTFMARPLALLATLPAAKAIGSVFTGIKNFLKNFGKMFAPLLKIGPRLLMGIPGVGLAVGVVMSILDFFDGFDNASEVLDKANPDMRDKISAGVASILGGIAGLFDSVLGLFGIETNFKESVTNFYAKYLSAILHPIDTFNDALEKVKSSDMYKSFSEGVDKLLALPKLISDTLLAGIKEVVNKLPDSLVPASLKEWAKVEPQAPVVRPENVESDIPTAQRAHNQPSTVPGVPVPTPEVPSALKPQNQPSTVPSMPNVEIPSAQKPQNHPSTVPSMSHVEVQPVPVDPTRPAHKNLLRVKKQIVRDRRREEQREFDRIAGVKSEPFLIPVKNDDVDALLVNDRKRKREEREEKEEAKKQAMNNTMLNNVSNNVNNSNTTVFNMPLTTKNDDSSIRMGSGSPLQFGF